MTTTRLHLDPRSFGRRRPFLSDTCVTGPAVSDDLRLFALTYLAGFVFVSILLA